MLTAHGLEGTCGGCPDGNHAASLVERPVDGERTGLGDLVPLRLDAMVFHAFDANGLKRAVADVQRDLSHLDAAGAERRNERLAEMQAGGGCRNRAGTASEHRLVSLPIRCTVVT